MKLWIEINDIVEETRIKTIPIEKKCKKAKWLFPVVMYGCESWTVKKAECRKIDAFEL